MFAIGVGFVSFARKLSEKDVDYLVSSHSRRSFSDTEVRGAQSPESYHRLPPHHPRNNRNHALKNQHRRYRKEELEPRPINDDVAG